MNIKTLLNYKTKAGHTTKPPFHLLVSPAQDANTLSDWYILRVTALGQHSLGKATPAAALTEGMEALLEAKQWKVLWGAEGWMFWAVGGDSSLQVVLGEAVGDVQVPKRTPGAHGLIGLSTGGLCCSKVAQRRKRNLIKWVVPGAMYQGLVGDIKLYF